LWGFIFLAIGVISAAFWKYKITPVPFVSGIIGPNVIIVKAIGGFILGVILVSSMSLSLTQNILF
jgi:hypothetical protein